RQRAGPAARARIEGVADLALIRLVLALVGALALAGCERAPERDWPEAAPALWEITGENGEQGWLFGTIHALPDGAEWRTPAFERAFAASDLLLVEIAELGDAAQARKAFDAYARSGPQPPLETRVAEVDRPALAALLDRAGMTGGDFWNVETWAAALILANAVRENDPRNGADRALLAGN